jgi:hypothetical protein
LSRLKAVRNPFGYPWRTVALAYPKTCCMASGQQLNRSLNATVPVPLDVASADNVFLRRGSVATCQLVTNRCRGAVADLACHTGHHRCVRLVALVARCKGSWVAEPRPVAPPKTRRSRTSASNAAMGVACELELEIVCRLVRGGQPAMNFARSSPGWTEPSPRSECCL